MALKGYNSYRGRQGVWRRLLVVVLLLILIAACGFLFLQRYITYSDDGSFYLDLPFEINWDIPFLRGGEQETGDSSGSDQVNQDMNLIVDRPQEGGEDVPGDGEQTPEDQDPDETPLPYLPPRLVELSEMAQDEAALIDALAAVGADGFVFRAKNNLGKVSYSSAVAVDGAVEEAAVSRDLLGRLCAQENVYTVARINCFRDPIYAFANMQTAGICQSTGYIWYDYNSQHWLDPEKEAARQYVIALALECAQLGFDELMLEDLCYPTEGKLYKIDYSKNTMEKTAALVLFLDELKNALEPYGVRLSLRLEENVVRGLAENTADSGFDAREILPMVDAVYAVCGDAETVRSEMKQYLWGANVPVLIPIVSEVTTEDGWCLVG